MTFNLFFWTPYLLWLYQRLKHWSQPTTYLVSGITSDLIRSRTDLLIENAMLRQQLIILNRQVKRPLVTKSRSALDGLVCSVYPILETSRSCGPARNGSSLASRPISILLAMEIEEKDTEVKDCH